jgi:hypothetical protein
MPTVVPRYLLITLGKLLPHIAKLDIPSEILEYFYAKVTSTFYSQLSLDTPRLEWLKEVCWHLGKLPPQGGVQPLLKFLHIMMQLLDIGEPLVTELQIWLKTVDQYLGIVTLPDQWEISQAEHNGEMLQSYLCAFFIPREPGDTQQLKMIACFHSGRQSDSWSSLQPEIQKPFSSQEIPSRLTKLIDTVRSRRERNDSLMIEVFLPSNLVFLALDLQAEIRRRRFTIPLGAEYVLAIRLLERSVLGSQDASMIDDALRDLERRWALVKKNGDFGEDECYWIDDHTKCEPRLLFQHLHRRQQIQCVIGTILPNDPDGVTDALIEAGVPIALWYRAHDIEQDKLRDMLQHLIHRGRNLPEALRDYRNDAFGLDDQPTHPGRHLTLIWDNPNRPPRDLGLFALE